MSADTALLDAEADLAEVSLDGERFRVRVLRLRTRQFFRMLRILTQGAPELMPSLAMNADGNPEQYVQNLGALLIYAIPEAEEQGIGFIKAMIEYPADVQESAKLDIYLDNPELDDLLTVIETIFRQESEDLAALGKRLQGMMAVAEKTGQTKPKKGAATGK